MHELKPLSETPLTPDFWLSSAVHSLITLEERCCILCKQSCMAFPESHLQFFTEGAMDKLLIKYAFPTVTTHLYIEFTQSNLTRLLENVQDG